MDLFADCINGHTLPPAPAAPPAGPPAASPGGWHTTQPIAPLAVTLTPSAAPIFRAVAPPSAQAVPQLTDAYPAPHVARGVPPAPQSVVGSSVPSCAPLQSTGSKWFGGAAPPPAPAPLAKTRRVLSSSYQSFCKEQRPLLPTDMETGEKESILGQRWKALSDTEKAKYAAKGETGYVCFCKEQRPLLPAGLRNAERERLLGQQWKALSKTERAKYKAAGAALAPAPVPALAVAPSTAD